MEKKYPDIFHKTILPHWEILHQPNVGNVLCQHETGKGKMDLFWNVHI